MTALEPLHWLIDGYNVICCLKLAPPGQPWFSPEARTVLLEFVERHSPSDRKVSVFFDGTQPSEPHAARIDLIFAPSADDAIVAMASPNTLVVTRDRSLGDRARHRGATVTSPWKAWERGGPPS